MLSIKELTSRHAQDGTLHWIGIRPARDMKMQQLERVEVAEKGLVGDRTTKANARSVTLIQYEHLPVIASLCGHEELDPGILRRNLVIRGINLLALKEQIFRIGDVTLQGTGISAPCSKMERVLGHGAYNAMRGHGGITAKVIVPGMITLGDAVLPTPRK